MGDAISWISTSSNWSGRAGIAHRLAEHIQYCGIALIFAVAIGVPIGLLVGHTGRGQAVVLATSGAVRALPTLGLLILLNKLDPLALWPVEVTLVVLAIPPIIANTSAGIAAVEPSARDAAKGIGMTPWRVLTRVEVPLALPFVLAGIRSAALQVVATATVAAYTALGGLGRFIIDGYAVQDYGRAYGGALVVVLLALGIEGAFALAQRLFVPPQLQPTTHTRGHRPRVRIL